MKTIFLVFAGMADIPRESHGEATPLSVADMPSMAELAAASTVTHYDPFNKGYELSPLNAMLSLFGYDFEKGIPLENHLKDFGFSENFNPSIFSHGALTIPFFSGHGATVTTSLIARGIGRLASLYPVDIYQPGNNNMQIADTIASETLAQIKVNEFVFAYVDFAYWASLNGDFDAKREAIELIDSNIITPIADFVWHAKEKMNLAVSAGFIASSHKRQIEPGRVPALIYYNDFNHYNHISSFNENLVKFDGSIPFEKPSDLIRHLALFIPPEEELPF